MSHSPSHHAGHAPHSAHAHHATGQHSSLNRTAFMATLHCLAGCAIGEVAGLVLGAAWGWSNGATIALAVGLAFLSGFGLTMLPLLRQGFPLRAAARLALAADTVSIAVMELVDNGAMLLIPGAMAAPVASVHFWASMVVSLALAGAVAFPVNRWLIARGRGHAVVHAHH